MSLEILINSHYRHLKTTSISIEMNKMYKVYSNTKQELHRVGHYKFYFFSDMAWQGCKGP